MRTREEEITLFNNKFQKLLQVQDNHVIDISGENLDEYVDKVGAYEGFGCINSPVTGYIKMNVTRHSNDWFVQQVMSTEQKIFLRAKRASSLSEWREVDFGESGQARIEIVINEIPAEHPIASDKGHGYMSRSDKIKLDDIADNANNYLHPEVHPASMITQDENHRFVSDANISTWNNKSESNHNHNDLYAPKNHTHDDIDDRFATIYNRLESIEERLNTLEEDVSRLKDNDMSEIIIELSDAMDELQAIVINHTDDF